MRNIFKKIYDFYEENSNKILKPIQTIFDILIAPIDLLNKIISWASQHLFNLIVNFVDFIYKKIFVVLVVFTVILLFFHSFGDNFLTDSSELQNYTRDIVNFNVSFSIGLAALLIAIFSFFDIDKTDFKKQDTINYFKSIVYLLLISFLLLLSSYLPSDYEIIIFILLIISVSITLLIILKTKTFMEDLLE
ncbi:hypothetical protein ACKXGF_05050 [Alkalibacillus sp. S2W]|uniref:hypothetical protein n=1 Tax=Alkalibacillus sp. S2W TaxID=3386553 RepID=UPI00398D6249